MLARLLSVACVSVACVAAAAAATAAGVIVMRGVDAHELSATSLHKSA